MKRKPGGPMNSPPLGSVFQLFLVNVVAHTVLKNNPDRLESRGNHDRQSAHDSHTPFSELTSVGGTFLREDVSTPTIAQTQTAANTEQHILRQQTAP